MKPMGNGTMADKLTERQAAVLTAQTGIMVGHFSGFHKYAEELLGRPVFNSEFANEKTMEKIKELSYQEFYDMCAHLLEDY